MTWPRFRIRSLMVVVVIVGLSLGVAMLTRENARLRDALHLRNVVGKVVKTTGGTVYIAIGSDTASADTSNQLKVCQTDRRAK